MSAHQREEEIRTLAYFSTTQLPMNKATTMGVIVDCSGIYKQQFKNDWTWDMTINAEIHKHQEPSKELRVYFSNKDARQFPKPARLGDILYIKKFKVDRKNRQLQAYSHLNDYCQWSLFDCQSDFSIHPYSTSRKDAYKQKEARKVEQHLPQLVEFSHAFLSKYSLLHLLPDRLNYHQKDYIVRVCLQEKEGLIVNDGTTDIILPGVKIEGPFDCFAKLRGVNLIQKNNYFEAQLNAYSSLIPIAKHTLDAREFNKLSELRKQVPLESQSVKQIRSMPVVRCIKKTFKICVQIASISPSSFKQAIKYYHEQTMTLADLKPSESMAKIFQGPFEPVYDITVICFDKQFSFLNQETQFFEVKLFSHDDRCADFVPRVNLSQLNQFTSYVQEEYLYQERVEELLNASKVELLVEVLFDEDYEERIFRLLRILRVCE